MTMLIRKLSNWLKPSTKRISIEDLNEDLREIGVQRIAGLGITVEQLEQWFKLQDLE